MVLNREPSAYGGLNAKLLFSITPLFPPVTQTVEPWGLTSGSIPIWVPSLGLARDPTAFPSPQVCTLGPGCGISHPASLVFSTQPHPGPHYWGLLNPLLLPSNRVVWFVVVRRIMLTIRTQFSAPRSLPYHGVLRCPAHGGAWPQLWFSTAAAYSHQDWKWTSRPRSPGWGQSHFICSVLDTGPTIGLHASPCFIISLHLRSPCRGMLFPFPPHPCPALPSS